MFEKSKAWFELIKLGKIKELRKDINSFFKGNIINILKEEGLFKFLEEARRMDEISTRFNYTDIHFLQEIINVLVDDKVLRNQYGKYTVENINYERKIPSIFTEAVVDIWELHAKFIPNRLRGEHMNFTSGFNLFNWDDALTNFMYGQIRKSAFAYSGVLHKQGKFLDIGCGNGYGTAAIWSYYYERGKIARKGSFIEIVGIDNDIDLLEIAENEFEIMLEKHLNYSLNVDQILSYKPKFIEGSAESIPFDENTFDFVYASQVLHWTDAKLALKEMIRVCKPGGIIFGTQNLYPDANPYNELHFKTIKGAGGFFSKEELYNWVKELGATKITNTSPITIFKIIK